MRTCLAGAGKHILALRAQVDMALAVAAGFRRTAANATQAQIGGRSERHGYRIGELIGGH